MIRAERRQRVGTINLNMAKRISNRRQWPVKRINHRDGSTTYKCANCDRVLCHDEPGTIRLGVLPHVEGDEDDMEAGVCVKREVKNE
jgi:hypothetical protein